MSAGTEGGGSGITGLIDRCNDAIGRGVSWLTLVMTVVTFVIVVLRYLFDSGYIWVQESVTWMHAAVFMLGAAYALQHDEHVRVDIFYRGMRPSLRHAVNAAGVLLFLLPFCGYLAVESWDFVRNAWAIRETSRESGGLPYPFVPLLKSLLLVMPLLLSLQGVSLLLRSFAGLRAAKHPGGV